MAARGAAAEEGRHLNSQYTHPGKCCPLHGSRVCGQGCTRCMLVVVLAQIQIRLQIRFEFVFVIVVLVALHGGFPSKV